MTRVVRSSSIWARAMAAVGLLFAATYVHAAQPINRLSRNFSVADRAELPHTRGAHIASATALGQLSGDTEMSSMSLVLQPTAAQDAALTQLLADQQAPGSPLFHKWLTPEEFGARFGVSDSDLDVLREWLASQGLQVTSIAPSRNVITFSGTSAAVENAFAVTMQRYSRGQKQFFENATDVKVPAAFAGIIRAVRGLSSYRLGPHVRITPKTETAMERQGSVMSPNYTSTSGSSHYLVPWDFRQIYGMNSMINSGFDGTGVKIAVIGQSAIDLNQIQYFQKLTGQTPKAPTLVLVPNSGTSTAYSGDEGESEVDLEYASGSAPGASIYFVYTGNSNNAGVMDALAYAITNNMAPVVTLSYGGCEADNALYGALALEPTLRQANAQGQTVLASSGDSNAAGCEATRIGDVTTATQGRTVSYPASSPYVTGVGGTKFNEGGGSYWSSSNNSQLGSALGYIPEVVWNDTTTGGTLSGTGGGASQIFGKPSWQSGTGVPADGARDVPDVAFASSNAHDGYLFCSAESNDEKCTATAFNSYVIGGTSLAAPNFAAMLAVILQKNASTGFGDLNPALYSIFRGASGSSVFHDVTSGNNIVACQTGTPDCTSGTFGYSAGVGYDQTTGLGSVNGSALATALASATETVPATPTIELTTSPVQPVTNASVMFKAQVSGKTSAPTGTVTFQVDGGTTSSAMNLGSSAYNTAVASFTPSAFLSAGSHTVVAVYSGDGTYAPATSTFTFVVANPLTGAFSVSATPTTLTLTNGTSGSETATATANNGFSDYLNFELALRNNYTIPSGVTLCYDAVTKQIPANGTITVSIPISTKASDCTAAGATMVSSAVPSNRSSATGSKPLAGFAVLALMLMGGVGVRGSRKLRGAVMLLVLTAGAFTAIGCGSGGTANPGSGGNTGGNGSAKATIPLTVYAFSSRDGRKTATADFTLVVQ